MKKFVLFFSLALIALSSLATPTKDNDSIDERKAEFYKEVRDYKHRFMARELGLSREQQRKFFPLYDAMEDETLKLSNETRALEKKLENSDSQASDLEYEKATEALFDQKIKEGEIEKSYLSRFAEILSKKQLFELKKVERVFLNSIFQYTQKLKTKKAENENEQP